jgi:hypothetical protein
LSPMLGLLSIFFNALYRVLFSFSSTTNTIFVVALSIILMRFYAKGKLYMFSNLILCNPFFLVMLDNLSCVIISHHFILLIIWFFPSMPRGEFFNFNSSSISQFELLMQWHFLSSFYDIVVIFILMFTFFFNLDG